MNPKIISAPRETSKYPRENAGKIMFEKLCTFNKETVAFLEVRTGEVCTYGDLTCRSLNLAATLRKTLGVVKDDILCIISQNSHKFWVATLAGFYLATPVHFLNPGYTTYELKKFLFLSQPKVVFFSREVLPKLRVLQQDCPFIEFMVSLNDVDDEDVLFYGDLIRETPSDFEFAEVSNLEQQVAYIANSSGTTGLPKGAMISHENLLLNYSHVQNPELYPIDHTTVVLHVIPFYHAHGCAISFCGLFEGVKFLIMNQFTPQIYLDAIQTYGVTKLFIVPTLADFFANTQLDQWDLSSVDEIYSGAGALKKTTYNKILKKFNLKTIRQIYGLTEMAAAVLMTASSCNKFGTCGKVVPGNSVKIVDPNTREVLGPNQSGEVCLKASAMIGYINDLENTRAAFDSDGFLRTGDIGYYDEDLDFYIVDRLKDLIKYKSFQVPPLEIEEILLQHPGVKDAAVVGKPDDRYGELAVGFVVKKDDVEVNEEEVVGFVTEFLCAEKRLHGGVRFVGEIPRNTIGKILRKDLRKLL